MEWIPNEYLLNISQVIHEHLVNQWLKVISAKSLWVWLQWSTFEILTLKPKSSLYNFHLIKRSLSFLFWILKMPQGGTFLVVQWLRIHLPMQGTRVRSMVQEDPTCHRTTKSMPHNYWTHTLEPVLWEATAREVWVPQQTIHHLPQLEKAHARGN